VERGKKLGQGKEEAGEKKERKKDLQLYKIHKPVKYKDTTEKR